MSKKNKDIYVEKNKDIFDPQKKSKEVLSTDNLSSPNNTPKHDRKVHSLNNAVVLYYYPRQTLQKGLYFEFRSDNPSPTSHC